MGGTRVENSAALTAWTRAAQLAETKADWWVAHSDGSSVGHWAVYSAAAKASRMAE